MYVVNNSSRALLVALIPLAVVHAVLTAMALLGAQAAQPTDLPAPDQVLVLYVARLATDGALLFAGHWMLRQRAISSRLAYALMGGVMAAAGYAIAIRNSFQLFSPDGGTLLTMGLLPVIAGMIAGFLYGQFAGLAPAARFPKLSYEGLATSLAFDGPTRVRTSVAAIVIAAMMPAVLTTVLSITLGSLLPGFVNYMSSGCQSRHRRGVAGAAVPDFPGRDHPAVGHPRPVPSSHCKGAASSSRVGVCGGRRVDGRGMRLSVVAHGAIAVGLAADGCRGRLRRDHGRAVSPLCRPGAGAVARSRDRNGPECAGRRR